MRRRHLFGASAAVFAAQHWGEAMAQASRAVCYNCPPEWADWAGALRAIRERLSIQMPHDNKNSGQALAALLAEHARPVADVVYLGGNFGPRAVAEGLLAPHRPSLVEEVPAELRDANGTGSPSTPARSASSSTARRCAGGRCRRAGATC
jgi:putative spermidine/putrescine transport system substrate-binding protein